MRILREHREIRNLLDRLDATVQAVSAGDRRRLRRAQALRDRLCGRVAAHVELEAAILEPALRKADGWGDARVAKLCQHQRAQRVALDGLTKHETLEPARFAERLGRSVTCLREEIEREESELLDPELLRDDVIGIGVEGG